jgi:putative restriction endonuclease
MREDRRQQALVWFLQHAQLEVPWSGLQLDDGTRLATAAKGIYKPAGSKYALSVSQRLRSPYEDDLGQLLEGGGGQARYHQEGPPTTDAPHPSFTNRGLIRCMEDEVPVGVLVQVSRAPTAYLVVGLAQVTSWEAGSFALKLTGSVEGGKAPVAAELWEPPEGDSRERARREVIRRRGQPEFRAQLLRAYGGICAVTRADAPQALEAAHITRYLGPESHDLRNGLLLRADIHSLFDLGLLAVDSKRMTCLIDSSLTGTVYAGLHGKKLHLPSRRQERPAAAALDEHRAWASL